VDTDHNAQEIECPVDIMVIQAGTGNEKNNKRNLNKEQGNDKKSSAEYDPYPFFLHAVIITETV
jgi:hypothetical protein